MPVSRRVSGSQVTIYHPVILAVSKSFAVTAVLPRGPEPPPGVVEAVAAFLEGDDGGVARLAALDKALAYSILYGGLQLVSLVGDPAPLARLHVEERIELGGPCPGDPTILDDQVVLQAYSLLYHGEEAEGLQQLAVGKCTIAPARTAWRPGGGLEVLPLGYRGEPAPND